MIVYGLLSFTDSVLRHAIGIFFFLNEWYASKNFLYLAPLGLKKNTQFQRKQCSDAGKFQWGITFSKFFRSGKKI